MSQDPFPRRLTRRQVRDLAAVGLLAVGGVGLFTVAYLVNVLLGAALTFAALAAAGVTLGLQNQGP